MENPFCKSGYSLSNLMLVSLGTGSGVGTKLLEILQDEYPDVYRCVYLFACVHACVCVCVSNS